MNDLERLRNLLAERFPLATTVIDKPETPSGSWWLDISLNGHSLVVEWRPNHGFGISTTSSDDYGSGPDEIFTTVEDAFKRVVDVLLGQIKTSPPELPLPKIRESRQLSQVELAHKLQINQGAVSRLERRNDMRVRTLRNLISAMGGELQLLAEFPDRTIRIQIDDLLSGDPG